MSSPHFQRRKLWLPDRLIMPDLTGIQYRPAPSKPLASHSIPNPLVETQTLWFKARRLLFLMFGNPFKACVSILKNPLASSFRNEKDAYLLGFHNEKNSHLLALPSELLLIIMFELSDASRASLALTCKGMLSFYSDFNSTPFSKIQFPSEQPLVFQSAEMSTPQSYQLTRWEFLRFLERDLQGTWYLCSECFILHPRRMYWEWIVPMYMGYYNLRNPEIRTCRHWRKDLCTRRDSLYAPSGIVDLCPCIKLTMGKKSQIEARLREDAGKIHGNNRPAADFWWHKCRHIYDDLEVELQIGLFLYDGTECTNKMRWLTLESRIFNGPPLIGNLGALLEYRLTFPSNSEANCPRLLCPHGHLFKSIRYLLECRETHRKSDRVCRLCSCVQSCEQCRTKVLNLRRDVNIQTNMTSCSFKVERCLDGNLWPMHTVFPFARRQVPLQHYPRSK